MLSEQQRARQVAQIRNLIDDLRNDPQAYQFVAKAVNEFVKMIGDLSEQRQFSVNMAACLEPDALEFIEVLGEGAKMVDYRKR